MWLQLSWLVVLFGAEISFAEQNVENYEYEAETSEISYDYKRLLSLYILKQIVNQFKEEKAPFHSQEISHRLEMPIRLVREILFNLNTSGLISELITETDKRIAYQPAFDINQMSISKVIDALEKNGSDNIPVLEDDSFKRLEMIMSDYRKTMSDSNQETLLKDL
jgi:membrane protein